MDHLKKMLALGFRFQPSPVDLIAYYLPRLIAGEQPHDTAECIHHADVYGGEPRELAGRFPPLPKSVNGDRFFFSTCKRQKGSSSRRSRAAGRGFWTLQTSREIKNSAGVKIGETKVLRFKNGGKYADWLMEEHHSCLQQAVAGDEEPVICRIYVSPRAPKDSPARQESAAFTPPQEPVPPHYPAAPAFAPRQELVITQPPSMKRPPPPVAEPPSAKKMRSAVSVTPLAQQSCVTASKPPSPCVPQNPPVPRRVMAQAPPHPSVPIRPAATPRPPCPPQRQAPLPLPAPVTGGYHIAEQPMPRLPPRSSPPQPSLPTAPVVALAPPPCTESVAQAMVETQIKGSLAAAASPEAPAAAVNVIVGAEEDIPIKECDGDDMEEFASSLEDYLTSSDSKETENNDEPQRASDEADPAAEEDDIDQFMDSLTDDMLRFQEEEEKNGKPREEMTVAVHNDVDGPASEGDDDIDQFMDSLTDDMLRYQEEEEKNGKPQEETTVAVHSDVDGSAAEGARDAVDQSEGSLKDFLIRCEGHDVDNSELQEVLDMFNGDSDGDQIENEDYLSLPLEYYNDKLFY
ncbi:hypothetical protein ABZP36_011891 [Zizania latifolia]